MNISNPATLPLPSVAPSAPSPDASPGTVFANLLVREMRATLPGGGWLGGGAFEPLESFFDEALAQQLAPHLDKAWAEGGAPTSPPTAGAAKPRPEVVHGVLSSAFGPRIDPFEGTHRHHHGIDIAAPRGTPVHAARGGRVIRAEAHAGYGKLVVVDHGRGVETRYAHFERIDVAVGDWVEAGSQVGTVGDSGRATGPHLHFEVRHHGKPIDPIEAGFFGTRD